MQKFDVQGDPMKPKHYYVNKIPQDFEMCQCQNLKLMCAGNSNPFRYDQRTLSHTIEFYQKYTNGEWKKQEKLTKTILYGKELTFPRFTVGIYYYYIYKNIDPFFLEGNNEPRKIIFLEDNNEPRKIIGRGDFTVRKCCQ